MEFMNIKDKKIAVINLIGNVFMKKSQDLFSFTEKIIKKIKLRKTQILL